MTGTDEIGRLVHLVAQSYYVTKKNRATFYIDGTNGADTNPGTSPDDAVATFNQAVSLAGAGDLFRVAQATYDEAVSVPAGLAGLEVICERGVIFSNTTPGTVISLAAPHMRWTGGYITQAGQIGMAITGEHFHGIDIEIDGNTIGFDINADHWILEWCRSVNHTTTGFDIAGADGLAERCRAQGTAATRGFYLSTTDAEDNILDHCVTQNCSGGGYECVAGADNNVFNHCSQSELCGGPVDAGANNTWIWEEESQIAVANSIQQDMADIHTLVGTQGYFEQNCPIVMNTTQTITSAAADKDFIASNATGADGLMFTSDAYVQRVMLVIIGRAVNSYAGNNELDCTTATHNQWKINLDGGAYSDLVNEEADGQMLDGDWQAIGEGAIHPFTFMFDVTSQVTNIDGKIGVRLENGRSAQDSFIVTCDIYLKVLWKPA